MSQHVSGTLLGIVLLLVGFPLAVIVGAVSCAFHWGDDADTAWAGFLWTCRMAFLLAALAVVSVAFALGMWFWPTRALGVAGGVLIAGLLVWDMRRRDHDSERSGGIV